MKGKKVEEIDLVDSDGSGYSSTETDNDSHGTLHPPLTPPGVSPASRCTKTPARRARPAIAWRVADSCNQLPLLSRGRGTASYAKWLGK